MGIFKHNTGAVTRHDAEQPPSYSSPIPSYSEATQPASDAKLPLPPSDQKDALPPSYDDNTPESSRTAASRPPPTSSFQPSSSSLFPPTFNVYMHFSTFTLGLHKDQPLYTILQTGLLKPLTLFSGPDKSSSPLATLKQKRLGATSIITVFPTPTNALSAPLEITVENHAAYHRFSVAPPGQPPRLFEWRSSWTEEIAALGGLKSGWKLVWMKEGRVGGEEVIVAVSTLNAGLSARKGLKFGFCDGNGGIGTGVIGEVCEVAAVVSGVSDFETYVATGVAVLGNAHK